MDGDFYFYFYLTYNNIIDLEVWKLEVVFPCAHLFYSGHTPAKRSHP